MGETPLRIRWNSLGIYYWFKLSVKYSSVARCPFVGLLGIYTKGEEPQP